MGTKFKKSTEGYFFSHVTFSLTTTFYRNHKSNRKFRGGNTAVENFSRCENVLELFCCREGCRKEAKLDATNY